MESMQANCLVSSICLLVLQNATYYNRENDWRIEDDPSTEEESRIEEGVSTGEDANTEDSSCMSRQVQNRRTTSPLATGFELKDPLHEHEFPYLALYARHHWAIHARNCAGTSNQNRVSTLVDEFLGLPTDSSPAYRCWLRMSVEDRGQIIPFTSIFEDTNILPRDLFPESIASFGYCSFDLATILPDCK
jgi:hypothetical protein